ncbi:helix-turn-helix domain-containing protein [Streptomyces echinatus]|uniref:helix-turn-helix domain-containing protein n=1 Tax=Streptomyces echinatus TaxID=67293 RepID=UPI00379DFB3A
MSQTQRKGTLTEPPEEPPQPAQADTPAEYVAALRTLRLWSGLTYRQLEDKATAHTAVLPASTVATTLGRATLPRERFVDAFTRACGLDEDEVRQWLEARRRIATQKSASAGDERGDDRAVTATGAAVPARLPRWRRVAGLLGAAGIAVAGTLGVSSVFQDSSAPSDLPAMPVTRLRMLAVGSWARIHPARTPGLCLTEGRDRTGRYESAVAAQRPCTEPSLPLVFLEPLGKDTVQIQWHHPKYGIGCLTVLLEGPAQDLIEPRDDCADGNRAQQFRIELYGPPDTSHFRIRPVVTGQCLSLRDQDAESGSEIVQGRCSGAPDQDFLIELMPPPQPAAERTLDGPRPMGEGRGSRLPLQPTGRRTLTCPTRTGSREVRPLPAGTRAGNGNHSPRRTFRYDAREPRACGGLVRAPLPG